MLASWLVYCAAGWRLWGTDPNTTKSLLNLAGLSAALDTRRKRPDEFGRHWDQTVSKWRETTRYEQPTRAMAEELIRAVSDTKEGVLP
jgi:hypothetical protein